MTKTSTPPKLIKSKLGNGMSKIQALCERNRLIRKGKQARISKTKEGYRVIVKEYIF